MDQNRSAGNRQEPIRDDLRQQNEEGKESTRIGSTYDDVTAREWKPGDADHHLTENPEATSGIQSGTGGNGGDLASG